MTLIEMGKRARQASTSLATASSDTKNRALHLIADALTEHAQELIAANKIDLVNGKQNGLSDALIDRLTLNNERIQDISDSVRKITELADPIGTVLDDFTPPNGLHIQKIRVPLGVIGIIYESRPNVTADAAALCLKSGNATILRGGKEAIHSNTAIAHVMRDAIVNAGLPADCVQLIEDTSRESANELMKLNGYIDVLIPRGGAGLIQAVVKNSSVPVIETGAGNCHTYIDRTANFHMGVSIIFNAKTSRPSVCNACETLLVDEDIAGDILPVIQTKLNEKQVELRGCEKTIAILGDSVISATEEDYFKEYNDYILAIKVVKDIDEAIAHIRKYSTMHSECIVTGSKENAEKFIKEIDAAAVYVNASTRFTDGGEFGFGAEIGISTQKLHARGPMGLNELTSIKYVITGDGQIR